MRGHLACGAIIVAATVSAFAQTTPREQLARGHALWNQRLSKSAIAALEAATRDKSTAAEAYEALGRLYTFRGWQQDNVFPGWHDQPADRQKAIDALKASLAAEPGRASAQDALRAAEGFAAADKVDPAPPRPEIRALDGKLQAFQSQPTAPIADILAALEARANAQADPAPYFVAAQILTDRGEYDRAIQTADRGAAVSDHFIDENLSAYQMSGKAQGSYDRGRATASDLAGWALFLKKDYTAAAKRLEEAERLYHGLDFGNEFHLAELAKAQGGRDAASRAQEHYLNALSLAGGPAPLRQRATQALAALRPSGAAGGFDAWLETELTKRRDERKNAALRSLVDRPLPALRMTTADGRPFDMASLKGKVVLLNFFASWCGICRAELPHLKTVYTKYQNDPGVAFLVVSIDEDAKRLERYLTEMKFPFAVARVNADEAERLMGFDNVPSTFYVDRGGIVRYQAGGFESHGDSDSRVSWFIDRLNSR